MTTNGKGLRSRLFSGLITAALVFAVPFGALCLLSGSSGEAKAEVAGFPQFKDAIKKQRQDMVNTLLASAGLPPAEQIEVKKDIRASDQGTLNPSTPVFNRFQ